MSEARPSIDPPPWFKLNLASFLTETRGLSLGQIGAYSVLMALYWGAGKRLPEKEEQLFRQVGAVTEEGQKDTLMVLDMFFPIADDGVRHHQGLDSQFDQTTATRLKQSAATKAQRAVPKKASDDADF